MRNPTPDEIELGLTDEDENVRVAFARRRDYTPTPAQIERCLTDEDEFIRGEFAMRDDYVATPAQLERGLRDKSEHVRMAFVLRKNSSAKTTPQHTACRARMFNNSDMVECLMETIRCEYAAHFRDGRICNHPSARQFVASVQS